MAHPSTVANPETVSLYAPSLHFGQLFSQITAFLTPIDHAFFPTFFTNDVIIPLAQIVSIFFIATCFGTIFLAKHFGRRESLATATAIVLVVGAPLITIFTFLSEHVFVNVV